MSHPKQFYTVLDNFVKDILITFPEYTSIAQKWWTIGINNSTNTNAAYIYCTTQYQKHALQILNKDLSIFAEKETSYFLPDIPFSDIWKEEISTLTRDAIWKHLQILLVVVVPDVHQTFLKEKETNDEPKKNNEDEPFGDVEKLMNLFNDGNIDESIDKIK
jgi:hypothetical protein